MEYAVRAGTTSAFNTGNCLATDQANFDERYPIKGCPKGNSSKCAGPCRSISNRILGFYDMHETSRIGSGT
jgi:formylglycine-generating enzyme required for sulfatase activity